MKYGIEENKARQIFEQIEKEIAIEIDNAILDERRKYEAEINKMKNQAIIEKELMFAGARNLKAVLGLIDIEEIGSKKLNINEIKNKIEELKNNENTSFLFFESNKEPRLKGLKPFESNLYKEKTIKNMDYEELCKYYEEMANI
ncbi:MAG: phage scaffolding protein, partial [Eubacteriales bacterium]|nr:phage scaffolding protein [Eubacteriales bacterium]